MYFVWMGILLVVKCMMMLVQMQCQVYVVVGEFQCGIEVLCGFLVLMIGKCQFVVVLIVCVFYGLVDQFVVYVLVVGVVVDYYVFENC